uniref:Putative ovule protein n=1 Tax=Solanum chacoense TaxID=4108 RepID=A0A0V0HL82_SOLCH
MWYFREQKRLKLIEKYPLLFYWPQNILDINLCILLLPLLDSPHVLCTLCLFLSTCMSILDIHVTVK